MTSDPTPWLDSSGLFPQRYAENRNPTWPTKWVPRTDAELARQAPPDSDTPRGD